MKSGDVSKLYRQYVLPTYRQFEIAFAKGKGSKLWDLEGREYLDFFPGWGVSALGHCHPDVVHALKNQARKLMHVPNNFLIYQQAKLAEQIIKASFPGKVFFTNSGTESNEAAIKYARKYGASSGRYEIITMSKSFHGRTMGSLAATAQAKLHEGFQPITSGFRYAEFNNLESIKEQINDKTVAVMLEPIQGEGGINVADSKFLSGLRKLCDEKKLLLIFDEVQTGFGRTGKLFGFKHYDFTPDIMTLAKALGNGVPIGALVVHERIAEGVFTPGSHGATYGGNPLVTATALAVLKTLLKKNLASRAESLGNYLEQKMKALKEKHAVIEEVKGLGLMRAISLTVPGAAIMEACLKKGLIINCTQDKILRIMPALTVSKKEIDRAFEILDEVLQEAAVTV